MSVREGEVEVEGEREKEFVVFYDDSFIQF